MVRKAPLVNEKLLIGLSLCLFLAWPCGGHGHSHDHHGHSHDEPPSFKYTKQANVEKPKEQNGHAHGHHVHADEHHGQGHHGHTHDHGHAHGHHGHAHGQHAHEHHGHAHGQHGHAHEHHGHAHERHGHAHEHQGHAHEQHGHAHEHLGHSHDGDDGETLSVPRRRVDIWTHAILSTALISAAPFFILFFIPIQSNSEESKPFLNVLLAFASGGLLGDAFLHLIPHAVSPHSHGGDETHAHTHSHGHSHEGGGAHDISVGLWTLAGILTFLCVEKFVRIVKGGHGHSHGPANGHSHAPAPKDEKKEAEPKKQKAKSSDDEEEDDAEETDEGEKADEGEEEEMEEEVEEIKVAGYLNLAADFAHNFTDGLAVGASYNAGNTIGVVTTLTILLHEVPHEIGDFAILVQSGYTKRKAMMLQLTTATGAMAGTVIGLLGASAGASWILPFTAGGFIYIATVSIIPELLAGKPNLWQSFKEIIAMLLGIGLMILIAFYE